MQHHAGGVENAAQARGVHLLERLDDILFFQAAFFALQQPVARALHCPAQHGHLARSGLVGQQMLQGWLAQKRVDRWKRP